MIAKPKESLADLYEADETAWLDATAELIRGERFADLDYGHLAECLEDMAKRDRREVRSELRTLIAQILGWDYQKDLRTPSRRCTIITLCQDLEENLLTSATLRKHAGAILAECYAKAKELAAAETGLDEKLFPAECPWTLEQLLSADGFGE
jgi:hypothetical protein